MWPKAASTTKNISKTISERSLVYLLYRLENLKHVTQLLVLSVWFCWFRDFGLSSVSIDKFIKLLALTHQYQNKCNANWSLLAFPHSGNSCVINKFKHLAACYSAIESMKINALEVKCNSYIYTLFAYKYDRLRTILPMLWDAQS